MLGFSWITSRSKHPKQSLVAQEAFKNFRLETILNIPGHIALSQVDVWFQDEARIGNKIQRQVCGQKKEVVQELFGSNSLYMPMFSVLYVRLMVIRRHLSLRGWIKG